MTPNVKDVVAKNEKKEEISRIVGESIQFYGRTPCRTNQEIAERLQEYFDNCYQTGQIPTVEDMCLALGVNRRTLLNWEVKQDTNPERAWIVQQAKEVLAAIDAKLVSEGKIPQVTYIFRAKNYFDMHDEKNVTITKPVSDPMGEKIDIERLRQKYLDNAYGAEDVTLELPASQLKDPK